jgi:serine protease Do
MTQSHELDMRNWIIIGFVILILGTATSVYLIIKMNQDLNSAQNRLDALQTNYQTLQNNLSDLQTSNTTIKTAVTGLQTSVATLQNTPVSSATGTSITGNTMVNLIPQIEPVVVRIDISGAGFIASGSGIIIRQDGYIITNQHVIDSATSIKVTLMNGQQYNATAVNADKTLDLAILKLSSNFGTLTAASLGSKENIVIGVSVIAAGYPEGLDLPGPASFTRGIVSATRTISGQNFVQTDATVNPGSSGGGLFTLDNKLIGITSSAVLSREHDIDGLGLAIPIDVVQTHIQNNLK